MNDRDADVAETVAKEITERGGTAVHNAYDVVTNPEELVAHAINSYGQLDIVVNNAGALGTTLFADTTSQDWHRLCDMHIRSAVGVSRSSWPHLLKSDAGRIINVSSVGMLGSPGFTAYGTGKAGVFGFTNSLAFETTGTSITVNCILPSAWSRMTAELPDPVVREVFEHHFQSEHVATFVSQLADPDCTVNGEAFEVGGGWASRLQLALGPAVDITASASGTWSGQSRALLRDGALTPVRTPSEWLGVEISRIAPELGKGIVDTPTEFNTLEYR
ncbi:hypothetical protein AZG88_43805 [Rhodococcus sp. LB1]|nr:hypothetical protein AZG88_43805 [Rhodococcus sp. LB1]